MLKTGEEREFLLAVFQELNEHMRNTEQKYLIVSAVYFGLFSVIISVVTEPNLDLSPQAIIAHFLLLLIGSAVYLLQGWYRSWKEHYLEVCLNIREQFIDLSMNERLFPYWLRSSIPPALVSIDNLMKSLTLLMNLCLSVVIAVELTASFRRIVVTLVALVFVAIYLILLSLLDRRIRPTNFLRA